MKVLALYMTYFRLPDDFSGGISDALRLMANYHDEVTGGGPASISAGIASGATNPQQLSLDLSFSEILGLSFDQFVDAVQEGKRLSGILQLKDFDPKVKITRL